MRRLDEDADKNSTSLLTILSFTVMGCIVAIICCMVFYKQIQELIDDWTTLECYHCTPSVCKNQPRAKWKTERMASSKRGRCYVLAMKTQVEGKKDYRIKVRRGWTDEDLPVMLSKLEGVGSDSVMETFDINNKSITPQHCLNETGRIDLTSKVIGLTNDRLRVLYYNECTLDLCNGSHYDEPHTILTYMLSGLEKD